MRTLSRPWADAALTALAPVIWGSTYIVTTELLPPDRPFTAAMLRTLPAGALLVLWMRALPRPGGWWRLALLSALNIGFFQAMLFVAAYRLPGGLAAVVGAIQPLLVMGLAWVWGGQRPASVAILAAVVGVGGMAAMLLSPDSRWDAAGVLAALAGTASMAAGTVLARRWQTGMPVLAFTGWQLLLGGAMLAPVAWVLEPALPALGTRHVLGYAYLCIAGALLAYSLWFRGIARLPSAAVSSLALLSPITAVVLGWALLGQAITGLAFAGLVAVLGSVLAVQWASAR
jgi:probable blue pigment (indigoidine) exporter